MRSFGVAMNAVYARGGNGSTKSALRTKTGDSNDENHQVHRKEAGVGPTIYTALVNFMEDKFFNGKV